MIKVEDPLVGDYLREAQPLWFAHLNAGAESVSIDLKKPAGRELFLRMVPKASIVLEGFRPGVMERLGLDYATLAERNPTLVLVSLSGYHSEGPRATRAGHDLNYLAHSGLLSLMESAPAFQLGDLSGGLMAATGALAALYGARTTGRGSHVQISITDTLKAFSALQAVDAMAGISLDREEMMLGGGLPCYRLYRTADGGQVSLAALEPKFWAQFCAAVERPDWVGRQTDPELRDELSALFRSKTLREWHRVADQAPDACLDPVLPVGQAVQTREELQPVRFGPSRPISEGPAPERGAHSRKFLLELGLSEQEILALAAEGTIGV